MTTRAAVEEFLGQKTLAVVGASRSGRGFGNVILKELRARGWKVLPVHPEAASLEGEPCAASLAALPEPAGGVIVNVPPAAATRVVREAAAAGISRVWLQQGAQSPEAEQAAREAGMTLVSGECVLMFAEPVGLVHRFHRTLKRWFGTLPA
ncbi:MAG TPA: CoA-binding protein [Thermoanaerobaculaceae bacterium]|nr:CoA-binding protein [Thermoanaerobaculaceae bacterium]HRS15255.1 CoA-binding protein [Thermoanaerobaculaceae bacterium]